MRRRKLLQGAAAGLVLAAWPGWLRGAFADEPCDKKLRPLAEIGEAFRRAHALGKPLLVFVIPTDEEQKWDRGRAFGELLNYGSDADLAPLALCEVVCADMANLRKIVPNAGGGEPLMVLVETEGVPATVRHLDAKLPPHDYPGIGETAYEDRQRADDAISLSRIATLSGLLKGAFLSDETVLARWAARAREGLPEADVARLERAVRGGSDVPLSIVDRGAAVVALASRSKGGGTPLSLLASVVRGRLKDKAPRGAHWAKSSGCGTHVEGVNDNIAYGCGMGHVPQKSARFLYFFSLDRHVL